jgi:hypothetical protein
MKKNNKKVNEVLNINVNPKNGETIDQAIRNIKNDVNRDTGGRDVNYVVNSEELNEEDKEGTDNILAIIQRAINSFIQFYRSNTDNTKIYRNETGEWKIDEVLDMVADYFEAKYLINIWQSEKLTNLIVSEIKKALNILDEGKMYKKKQLEEARIKTIKENNPKYTKKGLNEALSLNNNSIYTAKKWKSDGKIETIIGVFDIKDDLTEFINKLKKMGYKTSKKYANTLSKGNEYYTIIKNQKSDDVNEDIGYDKTIDNHTKQKQANKGPLKGIKLHDGTTYIIGKETTDGKVKSLKELWTNNRNYVQVMFSNGDYLNIPGNKINSYLENKNVDY